MNSTTKQFKKQLPRNAVTAIFSFCVGCLTAVWLTPYLVKHLGNVAYGLIPLAGLLTQYASLITMQLSASVRRFMLIEIQKPKGNPNITFNSALFLYLLLILVQIPIFVIVITRINYFFSIPPELLKDAQILLLCSVISFMISLLSSIFGVSIYSHNRLDIKSTLDLIRNIFRLIFIVTLFSLFGAKLRYIGYVELLLASILGICNIYYLRKLTPELFLNIKIIDLKILIPIFKMSFWTLVNNLGSLLYLRTDIWIINRFISADIAGQYAAILVLSNFIKTLGRSLNVQIGPTILNYTALKEWDQLKKLLQISVRMIAILIAIPIGIICSTSSSLLNIWLGADFVYLTPVVWLITIHLFINTSVSPLFSLQSAINKVKLPGLVTLFMGMLNVVLAYVLGISLNMGVIGIALGGAIILTLKNALFTPIYSAKCLMLPKTTFITPFIGSLVVFVFIQLANQIPIAHWLNPQLEIVSLGITTLYLVSISIPFIWFIVIKKQDQKTLKELIPKRIVRIFKKSKTR